jgi:hypothetical protein
MAVVVVMIDKGGDGRLRFALQVVVFQKNAVLEGLVPALDLALRLGMIGRAAHMIHAIFFEVFSQLTGDVTRAARMRFYGSDDVTAPRTASDVPGWVCNDPQISAQDDAPHSTDTKAMMSNSPGTCRVFPARGSGTSSKAVRNRCMAAGGSEGGIHSQNPSNLSRKGRLSDHQAHM